MLIEDEDVQEFKKIYEEEFDEPISNQEAIIMASRLVTLYEALARPLPSELANFTDSREAVKLDLGVGSTHEEKPPISEKVAL